MQHARRDDCQENRHVEWFGRNGFDDSDFREVLALAVAGAVCAQK